MKDLYMFTVSRKIKGSRKKEKVKVIIKKPNYSLLEEGEFYYASKYNEFLNAGFLSKAMVQKKFSDLGGPIGKDNMNDLTEEMINLYDSQKTVQFYGAAGEKGELNPEQAEKLRKAEKVLVESRKFLVEQNLNITAMFNQTADAKAQEKLIKWFALFCTFYEENIGKDSEEFELFEGSNLDEKTSFYAQIMDDNYDEADLDIAKRADIIKESLETLGKALAIWYNGLADDQKGIEEQIKAIDEAEAEAKSDED